MRGWRAPRDLAMIVLGIYLLLVGILHFVTLSVPGIDAIVAILAIVAGALILMRR